MEWIKVTDRLPELIEPLMGYNDDNEWEVIIENYQSTVLAYNEDLGIFKAQLTKRGWCEISSISSKGSVKPSFWMPLPEPPKY